MISPLPEYESMKDVLRIARNRTEFLQLVQDALNETDDSQAAARQASVASGTWDARAEWVSELIERLPTVVGPGDQAGSRRAIR